MGSEAIDYQAVLADLKAKRDALDQAIEGIEQVLFYYSNAAPGAGRTQAGQSLPADAFFGLSIGDAIKKYLGMVRRKQSISDIVAALEQGGFPHASKDFAATVRSAIFREVRKPDSGLVRLPDGEYGLSSWYPGLRKQGRTQESTGTEETTVTPIPSPSAEYEGEDDSE